MDKTQNLLELERLYSQYKDIKEFDSKDSLINWASKVIPLLKFNRSCHVYFAERLDWISGHHISQSALDIMTTQVQIAIEDLKIQTKETEDPVNNSKTPKKIKYKNRDQWYKKPIGIIILAVIAIVIAAFCIWTFNHYFPTFNL